MNFRLIARLDIKGSNVVKGIQMDGLRIIGNPESLATNYYNIGADEISLFDIVASLYGRNNLTDLVSKTAASAFIPLTVTGGIRSLQDAKTTITHGADKVGVNTAGINNPNILREISKVFGNQATVVSIEAKSIGKNYWECYTESGRQATSINVIEWVNQVADFGVGEISLTSVDRDGTLKGPDLDLIATVRKNCPLPLVVGGGISSYKDILDVANLGADGVMIGLALHKEIINLENSKKKLSEAGFTVRN